MSGGAFEFVMSNLVDSTGTMFSSNSGFSTYPNKRYYDKYSYGTSYTEYTRGKLGDATKEMAPTGIRGNWYSGYAFFPHSSSPWFVRGGSYGSGSSAGLFGFLRYYGNAFDNYSARASLVVGQSSDDDSDFN